MDMHLTGKTAFVSGSTHGIGLAVAAALAREGARVVVNGRDEAGVAAAWSMFEPKPRPGPSRASPGTWAGPRRPSGLHGGCRPWTSW